MRAIASISRDELRKIISKYGRMGYEDLVIIFEAKLAPALELHVISIFLTGIDKGDQMKLGFLIEQSLGKPPVSTESDEERAEREALAALTDEELANRIAEKFPNLKSA